MAMPQEIEYMDKLPKTRSGKIMRIVLRAKEWVFPDPLKTLRICIIDIN